MIDDDDIVRALEAAQVMTVTENYAASVMARVPAQRSQRVIRRGTVRRSLGGVLAWMGVGVVFAAMLWVPPRSEGSVVWLWMQVLLCIEFSGLLLWFAL